MIPWNQHNGKGENRVTIGQRNNNRNFVALGRASDRMSNKKPWRTQQNNIGFVALAGGLGGLAARMSLYQVYPFVPSTGGRGKGQLTIAALSTRRKWPPRAKVNGVYLWGGQTRDFVRVLWT